jgi:phosphatidylglycerophosphate synthase
MAVPSPRRLQVLARVRPAAPLVAGLPCGIRAAFRAGKELAPDRIILAGAGPETLSRWSFQLQAAGAPVMGDDGVLDARLPVLAVADDAFPDAGSLEEFAAAAEAAGGGRRLLDGRAVAAYVADGGSVGAGTAKPAEVLSRALASSGGEVAAGAFLEARAPADRAAAAGVLYRRMTKDNDGYLARLDRHASLAITRLLLPFPVSPNQVTAASLLVSLFGAWWLAAPNPLTQFWGALTLWFCCLLDGCDGEIARLKHHITPWGGDFDLAADHVAHLVTFIALPVGVARLHPGTDWRLPGVLLVTGFLACGFSVYWLVLRVPEEKRGPLSLIVERVASRDYVYLILALTAIGRLDWFVWAAAFGSHAFWAGLWLASSAI